MCGIGALLLPPCVPLPVVEAWMRALECSIAPRGPSRFGSHTIRFRHAAAGGLYLSAAVLHMRGEACTAQPLVGETGDVLCWNGEVYAGMNVADAESDTLHVLNALSRAVSSVFDPAVHAGSDMHAAAQQACACLDTVARVLARLIGPAAFLFYHAASETLYFGRDAVGRRSLLLHKASPQPTSPPADDASAAHGMEDYSACATVLTSVGFPLADVGVAHAPLAHVFPFEELAPTGVYALRIASAAEATVEDAMLQLRGGEHSIVWQAPWGCSGASAASEWSVRCHHAPWPAADTLALTLQQVAHRCPVPRSVLRAPFVPDADLAACSLELLARLSAAVRVRVSHVAADLPSHRLPAVSHVPFHLLASPASAPQLAVSEARERLASEGFHVLDLPSNAAAYVHAQRAAAASDGYSLLPTPTAASNAQVAILFSGGLDSMVVAALAHHHTPADQAIDLLNVCFDARHASPDRLAALAGVAELQALYPTRQWQFIHVDESYAHVYASQAQLAALLAPRTSHMDFNIGAALHTAAAGVGYVYVPGAVGTSGAPARASAHGLVPTDDAVRHATMSDGSNPHDAAASLVDAMHVTAALRSDGWNVWPDVAGRSCSTFEQSAVSSLSSTAGAAVAAYLRACEAVPADAEVEDSAAAAATAAMHTTSEAGAQTIMQREGTQHAPVTAQADVAARAHTERTDMTASGHAGRAAGAAGAGDAEVSHLARDAGVEAVGAQGCAQKKKTRPCRRQVDVAGHMCGGEFLKACKNKMCRACCRAVVGGTGVNYALGGVSSVQPCPAHGHTELAAAVAEAKQAALAAAASAHVDSGSSACGTAATAAAAATCVLPVFGEQRVLVRSSAKVLLLGMGADETMLGYARHRSCFAFGWERVQQEREVDCNRIWLRNLGRDDRVCSAHGREPRFPFLDEAVTVFLRQLPLPVIADLRLPYGVGDKRLLRVAARMLGLAGCTTLVKRAIHFGSRIAKQSNVHTFGSNRAAKGDAVYLFTMTPGDGDE